jgi:hypothetical protein
MTNLEQETVASLLLNRCLDPQRVRDRQIVTNDLNSRLRREVAPRLPVILVKRILNRHHRVLLHESKVDVRELLARDPLGRIRVRVLEIEVVFSVLVELRRRDVEGDADFALVAGLFDCLCEELKRLVCAGDVGRESTLVTNVSS